MAIKISADSYPPRRIKENSDELQKQEVEPRDYVLSDILPEEWDLLNPTLDVVGKFIDMYIKYDFNAVLNEYSIWKKSYSGADSSGIISPKEES